MSETYTLDDCDRLADYYLGTQDHARALRNVLAAVQRYAAGFQPTGEAGARRTALNRAAKHARGLSRLLTQIDPVVLANAMGHGIESPGYQMPHRLADLLVFVETLREVANGLEHAASGMHVPANRPEIADPIVFGVEALASLWVKAGKAEPIRSYKARQFGDFVVTVLGPKLLGFADATVRHAVRLVLMRQAPATTS